MRNDYIVRKLYYSFVTVSILSALTATVGMLIDNIIVGRYLGSDALGAMGVVGPVSLLLSAFGNICSGGGTARASQAVGRGDKEQVCRIFTVTMLFAFLAGMTLTAAGLAFTPQITDILGAKGVLKGLTEQYLYGYFFGALPTVMLTALMGFVRVDGSPRLPVICIAVMSVCNIALDLIMVLVLHKGMLGMALATAVSYYIAFLTGCSHFISKRSTLKLVRVRGIAKELSATIVTGAPTAISRISDTLKVMILNNLMVTVVGVGAVTALNVRTQANNIVGALIVGIGQAVIPVVGMFYGEEDRTALRDTLKTTLKMGLVLSGTVALALLIFPSSLTNAFGVADPKIMEMSNTAVRLFAVGMPVALLNAILMNFYQSTGKTGLATVICVLQSLVYTVVMAFILIRPMGSTGVWIAFLLGEVCTLITIVLYVTRRNGKFSLGISAYMLLEEGFGGDPKDRLELSIGNSMDEVMSVSTDIYKLGRSHNIDEKMLNEISLCIEEMAGNVVRHAFRPGEKKWFDVLILDKPDSVVVRMRDNGAAFDPWRYINTAGDPKKGERFGIRIIASLASQVDYSRNMGLNVLIIVLNKPAGEKDTDGSDAPGRYMKS